MFRVPALYHLTNPTLFSFIERLNNMTPPNRAVDWRRGKVQLYRVNGLHRSRMVYPAVCPNCGRALWLPCRAALQAVRQHGLCHRCVRSEKARRVWQTLTENTTTHFTLNLTPLDWQDYPFTVEQIVANWLEQFDLPYQHQVWLETPDQRYCLDFVVNGHYVIEIQSPTKPLLSDQARQQIIRQHYQLLILDATEVRYGLAWERIERHLVYGEPL
jgi:hypothetical protein